MTDYGIKLWVILHIKIIGSLLMLHLHVCVNSPRLLDVNDVAFTQEQFQP